MGDPLVRLGEVVPSFTLDTYDPVANDFATFRLEDQVKNKRWTILFFYPADFTFV